MTLALTTLELIPSYHNPEQNRPPILFPRQKPIACQIIHAIPGRIRIGIPKLAQESTYREKLTYALESLPWVSDIRINLLASCVIINYQSQPYSDEQKQASLLAMVQAADTLSLLPTGTLEEIEPTLTRFWDGIVAEFKALLAEFEGITKYLLRVIAIASLIVGILGLILPLLPGVPFLVLSHFCFLACA